MASQSKMNETQEKPLNKPDNQDQVLNNTDQNKKQRESPKSKTFEDQDIENFESQMLHQAEMEGVDIDILTEIKREMQVKVKNEMKEEPKDFSEDEGWNSRSEVDDDEHVRPGSDDDDDSSSSNKSKKKAKKLTKKRVKVTSETKKRKAMEDLNELEEKKQKLESELQKAVEIMRSNQLLQASMFFNRNLVPAAAVLDETTPVPALPKLPKPTVLNPNVEVTLPPTLKSYKETEVGTYATTRDSGHKFLSPETIVKFLANKDTIRILDRPPVKGDLVGNEFFVYLDEEKGKKTKDIYTKAKEAKEIRKLTRKLTEDSCDGKSIKDGVRYDATESRVLFFNSLKSTNVVYKSIKGVEKGWYRGKDDMAYVPDENELHVFLASRSRLSSKKDKSLILVKKTTRLVSDNFQSDNSKGSSLVLVEYSGMINDALSGQSGYRKEAKKGNPKNFNILQKEALSLVRGAAGQVFAEDYIVKEGIALEADGSAAVYLKSTAGMTAADMLARAESNLGPAVLQVVTLGKVGDFYITSLSVPNKMFTYRNGQTFQGLCYTSLGYTGPQHPSQTCMLLVHARRDSQALSKAIEAFAQDLYNRASGESYILGRRRNAQELKTAVVPNDNAKAGSSAEIEALKAIHGSSLGHLPSVVPTKFVRREAERLLDKMKVRESVADRILNMIVAGGSGVLLGGGNGHNFSLLEAKSEKAFDTRLTAVRRTITEAAANGSGGNSPDALAAQHDMENLLGNLAVRHSTNDYKLEDEHAHIMPIFMFKLLSYVEQRLQTLKEKENNNEDKDNKEGKKETNEEEKEKKEENPNSHKTLTNIVNACRDYLRDEYLEFTEMMATAGPASSYPGLGRSGYGGSKMVLTGSLPPSDSSGRKKMSATKDELDEMDDVSRVARFQEFMETSDRITPGPEAFRP